MLIIGRAFQGTAGGGLVQLVNIVVSDIFSMRLVNKIESASVGTDARVGREVYISVSVNSSGHLLEALALSLEELSRSWFPGAGSSGSTCLALLLPLS